LRLRWQAKAGPFAVFVGLIPGDAYHRLVVAIEASIFPVFWKSYSLLVFEELAVLNVCDRAPAKVEVEDLNFVLWSFSGCVWAVLAR
jgi:hypothetical protein